ncbi:MAG: hypothetical protein KME64_37245 [Scytonematopsis contorta HA4267-MV1]|jgi:hypothetical protein|nr:hypothetical protein [Scytonematopsis contorta HA4267-MV1]
MKLSGEQRKKLQSALVSAFSRKSLEQLLSHNLEEILHQIPLEGALNDIVFELIKETERCNLTEKLVRAAREENPGDEELEAVEKELFPNLKTKSLLQKGRQNSRPDSPEVPVKLDSDMIINFDLRDMIIKFQGKFKQTSGVFAFSVDGDYTILQQYIIERIKRELKHITKRPNENDNRIKLLRGGSWINVPVNCRSTSRDYSFDNDGNYVGFRVMFASVARII